MYALIAPDCECGERNCTCEHEARRNDLTFAMWNVTVIPFLFTTCIGGEVPTEDTQKQ